MRDKMRDKKSSAQGSRASRWRNPPPSRLFAGVHRQRPHLSNSASRPETKAEAQCIHCIRAVFARRIPRRPYSAKSRRLPSASCVRTRILPKPTQTPNATPAAANACPPPKRGCKPRRPDRETLPPPSLSSLSAAAEGHEARGQQRAPGSPSPPTPKVRGETMHLTRRLNGRDAQQRHPPGPG